MARVAKPTDFFVGITDLFSILLPGACIAYIAVKLNIPSLAHVMAKLRLEGNEGYLAFFVVAYVLGHLLDMAGAFFLDKLYDVTYARRMRRSRDGKTRDPLFEEAGRLAVPAMPTGDRVYQWSRVWACLKSPSAFTEIERVQANSKFFRGLVSVFLITAILLVATKPQHGRVIAAELACCLLAAFAFLRFSDLRWKAVQQTYRFFIAMQRGAPGATAATPASENE